MKVLVVSTLRKAYCSSCFHVCVFKEDVKVYVKEIEQN